MAQITGVIIDDVTNDRIEARVQILGSNGMFSHPSGAIMKVGTGPPFFYSDGDFHVDVPRGLTQIIVERGTEYVPYSVTLDLPAGGNVSVEVSMKRWTDLGDIGWHPGNTHIHYDENESNSDERLRLDPRVEDLRMTAVSILRRWDLEYVTNKYPVGVLNQFSTSHHYVQCGEENRHNDGDMSIGYGHVMLLNIRNIVEPVSRGMLVDAFDPDYPPLSYACDDAHRQGGIVIWCHNGRGMEAPVAAALGKLDAFNLFDPYWEDTEYDIYYRMLNAGMKLPASTGSDWFICSSNRVYGYTGKSFDYEPWISALKAGRTFITNGPALFLNINGESPGGRIETIPGKCLPAVVNWSSHYPIKSVEILYNGKIVSHKSFRSGSRHGSLESEIKVGPDGWIAARLSSDVRDSFAQPLFAHTSPIYLKTGLIGEESKKAALWFDNAIQESLEWVKSKGKFYSDKQRHEVVDLFREGQKIYRSIAK